jgi:hypothetical protein
MFSVLHERNKAVSSALDPVLGGLLCQVLHFYVHMYVVLNKMNAGLGSWNYEAMTLTITAMCSCQLGYRCPLLFLEVSL